MCVLFILFRSSVTQKTTWKIQTVEIIRLMLMCMSTLMCLNDTISCLRINFFTSVLRTWTVPVSKLYNFFPHGLNALNLSVSPYFGNRLFGITLNFIHFIDDVLLPSFFHRIKKIILYRPFESFYYKHTPNNFLSLSS